MKAKKVFLALFFLDACVFLSGLALAGGQYSVADFESYVAHQLP